MSELRATAERLLGGERRTLAQLVTLAESKRAEDRAQVSEVLRALAGLAPPRQAMRVAFTGPPGAGKSSLIECMGSRFVPSERRIAVLAFDPSSPTTGGSLLADRTRMPELSARANAFIRPSPQGAQLGGLGEAAATSLALCEWAGYDPILLETVGVGQGEVDARAHADCVVLVLGPDSGDELQGMKRGINETCDFVVINKKDLSQARAEQLELAYRSALTLGRDGGGPEVRLTSALDGSGVSELWAGLCAFHERLVSSGALQSRRDARAHNRLRRALLQRLERSLGEGARREALLRVGARLTRGELSLDEAVGVLMNELCPEP